MNLTVVVWLLLFAITSVLSFRRASWAVALYMLTFFLSPPFWWWGGMIEGIRWNFISSFILFGSLFINGAFSQPLFFRWKPSRRLVLLAVLVAANASAVHYLLAPNLKISAEAYTLLVKHMGLFILLIASVRDEVDLKIVVVAIVLGATYIGYEVTINDRGKMSGGRLEGVGVPNASTANDLACLMVSVAPLVAPLFLFGGMWKKLLAVVAGPFILNVILLCNSRGAFLAIIVLGLVYLFASPRAIRPQVYRITALGILCSWMLMGDPRIVERFLTTFAGSEERDNSAAGRLDFWKAGMMLVRDRPLGSGGYGFKTVYGPRYLEKVTGDPTARSVHQGYINEACEWGIQGLALRLAILVSGIYLAWKASRQAMLVERWFIAGVNLSLVAAITGLMVQSFFGTFLPKEWGLYFVALAIGSSRILFSEYSADEEGESNEFLAMQPADELAA